MDSRAAAERACAERNCMNIFAASVLPAPDSPVMTTVWFFPDPARALYALSARTKMCGGTMEASRSW